MGGDVRAGQRRLRLVRRDNGSGSHPAILVGAERACGLPDLELDGGAGTARARRRRGRRQGERRERATSNQLPLPRQTMGRDERIPVSERFALRVMQIGAVAVVLAVSTLNAFELDRFFVPKEIVLHVTAVIAGLFALRAIARSGFSRVDLLLVIYLLLSSVSSLLATNRWLALRALTITASSIVIFWTARGLREAGLGRPLINGLALAVVVVAVMSLLQTYGLSLVLFSESRAPGGTLGNRTFVAHIAAIGLPLLFLVTRRLAGFVSIAIVI